MINHKQLQEQLDNIKKDPTYIDCFIVQMTDNWGEDIAYCIDVIQEAMLLISKEENKKAYVELLILKVKYYFMLGKYSEGIEALLEGKQILLEAKNEEEIEVLTQLYTMLLVGFMRKGVFKEAITYGLKALEKAEQVGRFERKARVLLYIIDLYVLIKAYQEAKEILESIGAIEYILMDTLKIEVEIGWLNICLSQNQLERAAEHCKKAYDLAKKNEQQYALELLRILSLRAELNVARQLYTQAEKDFNEVTQRLKKIPFKQVEAQTLLSWAKFNKKQGRTNEAIDQLEAVIAKQTEDCVWVNESYRLLSEIYEDKKEWALAYEYIKKYEIYHNDLLDIGVLQHFNKFSQSNMSKDIETYKLRYQDIETLASIGTTLTKHFNALPINDQFCKQLTALFKMDLLSVLTMEEEIPCYHLLDHQGGAVNDQKELARNMTYLADYCMRERSDICVSNGDFEVYHIRQIGDDHEPKVQSLVFTPIIINRKAVGAIGIGSYKVNMFNRNDLSMLQVIASYLAITIQNTSLYHQSEYLSIHDSLTGLLNRSALLKQGEILFKKNHKQRKSTVIMMLDVDFLKQINDRYGHEIGDEVLKKIGELLKHTVRKQDYVGRYNGEEFLMILDDLSEKEVIKVCQRIKKALNESTFETKKENQVKVTISAGFYICNEYTLNLSDAIQFADHALYRAKLLGRNHIVSYALGENNS